MKTLGLVLPFFVCLFFSLTIYAAADLTGTIVGDVRLSGDIRPKKTTPAIVEYRGPCGVKRSTSVVKLWKSRVMDVTLWLTPIDSDFVADGLEIEEGIVSYACEFWPKMLIVPPSAKVKIVNKDSIVQWLIIEGSKPAKEQIMQEAGKEPTVLSVPKDHSIRLTSGFYPWMEAWIRPVADSIVTTYTGWDGRFFIRDVLPGKYILHAWHSSLGEISREIDVRPNKKAKTTVIYNMPEDKSLPVIESSMLKEFFEEGKEVRKDYFEK